MVIANEIASTLALLYRHRTGDPARMRRRPCAGAGRTRGAAAAQLATDYPKGLHRQQSAALAANAAGVDVCLATPTASGKSLWSWPPPTPASRTAPRESLDDLLEGYPTVSRALAVQVLEESKELRLGRV